MPENIAGLDALLDAMEQARELIAVRTALDVLEDALMRTQAERGFDTVLTWFKECGITNRKYGPAIRLLEQYSEHREVIRLKDKLYSAWPHLRPKQPARQPAQNP